jgi:hypothetical protein
MRLIRRARFANAIDTAQADALWGAFFRLPLTHYGRAYYSAIRPDDAGDSTFALEQDGRIVAMIECDSIGGDLGRFGFPIEVRVDSGLDYPARRKVVVEVMSEFKRLLKEQANPALSVRITDALDPDGLLLGYLIAEGASCRQEMRAEIDLALDEQSLFDDLRKGHRQQVRWGEQNLIFSAVDAANPDRAAFETYRQFHIDVSGRVTRNAESWEAMFAAISAGHGDLMLGFLEGVLVSGTLILDGGGAAYYASGVYHRAHFDKPLGHASLYKAVLRSKTRGLRFFDVGELPDKQSETSEKEIKIGFFKRGFTNRTVSSRILTLPGQGKREKVVT